MSVAAPGERSADLATARAGRSMLWPALGTYVGTVLYLLAPHHYQYPGALATIITWGLVPALCYRARPRPDMPVCPLNWALLAFFLQLVVVPLLVCFYGPYHSTLPELPSDNATNLALALSCLAYAAFCVAYHIAGRGSRPANRSPARPWSVPSRTAAVTFFVLGIVGVGLTFHGVSSIFGYFAKPQGNVGQQFNVAGDSVLSVAGVILRTFLGFGCIVAWCAWIDRRRDKGRWRAMIGTLLAAAGIIISYGTFAYNRGAFAAPLVAVAAVYGTRVRKLTVRWVVVVALIGLFLLAAFRVYRNSHVALGQAVGNTSTRQAVLQNTDLNTELQIYGGAPQFTGFLLQQTQYARRLYLGKTLLSSAMYPVPRLGTPFRPSSGVDIYNRLIYGNARVVDQVIPFQGELFINFDVVGVLFGYLLLGLVLAWMQRGFLRAPTAVQAFSWQYAATWIVFLVAGSIAVVSQIFIYFFWPIYALALWSWLRRSSGGSFEVENQGAT